MGALRGARLGLGLPGERRVVHLEGVVRQFKASLRAPHPGMARPRKTPECRADPGVPVTLTLQP